MFEKLISHSGEEIGSGIEEVRIRDFELKLNIQVPDEFRAYLKELNYAELYSDPIYGIDSDLSYLDLYIQNHGKEHLRYGFLEIFNNDIDGTIFLRLDNGKIYNGAFQAPIAESFTDFIQKILS